MRFWFFILPLLMMCGCSTPSHHRDIPAAQVRRHKQIFLVMDDAGLSMEETRRFLDIPVPMTIAVLPHQRQTDAVCRAIQRCAEKEIILHQPMEAYDAGQDIGLGGIYSSTPPDAVAAILDRNLSSVHGAVGVNNHMGSRITENQPLMRAVLRYCKENGLFFLDSKTGHNSQVSLLAHKENMHMEQRHVFLDVRRDRAFVRGQWSAAVRRAREQGYAVVIGHVWCGETADAIRDSCESLKKQGYTFHKLSELYE